MDSRMEMRDLTYLVGMQYYGNPTHAAEAWTAENEIGRLWSRFNAFMDAQSDTPFRQHVVPDAGYEMHVWDERSTESGESLVMVGIEVRDLESVPVELVVKVLPAGQYAVFTARGREITGNWGESIYGELLPKAGLEPSANFLIERYDGRFQGLEGEALEQSELEILVPIQPRA